MKFKMTRRDPRDEKRKKEQETNFSVENENTSLSLSLVQVSNPDLFFPPFKRLVAGH